MTVLTGIGRLFTAGPQGTLEDAAVAVDGDRIRWVGPAAHAPGDPDVVDLGGCLVTPGLVDAHSHPVYTGPRSAEVARRSSGVSYAQVSADGGGIRATVRSTRAAHVGDLEASAARRLAGWLRSGTTTVEAKTGYHLNRQGELAAVRLLRRLGNRPGVPRIAITFLAAHAVPPEWERQQYHYAAEAAGWAGEAAAAGAAFVDVFCDEGAFTVEESRRVLTEGAAAGLVPRVHADELARTGGALLAAEVGAASADHLLRATEEDAAALAAAGVTAVLCPGTALSLGVAPPARLLADAGVPLALGSDHNPGTSGIASMSLVMALAVAALGLSVDEAVVAATAGGARSLRASDRGVVEAGRLADLVAWDADHEGAFAWGFGLRPSRVWLGGQEVDLAG